MVDRIQSVNCERGRMRRGIFAKGMLQGVDIIKFQSILNLPVRKRNRGTGEIDDVGIGDGQTRG